jgi:hypothetical protein
VKYINNITLSKKILSLTGTTSLDQALKSLVVSNDKVDVQLSTCNQADKDRIRQRFAYQALLHSTGMGFKAYWFASPNECDWVGITCNANKTTKLDLNGRRLKGTIPDDVGLWTGLTSFDVAFNQLSGSLPFSIGLWTGLNYFNVYKNKLAGPLPTSIGFWTGLLIFYGANNELTGTVPKEVSNWASIQHAYFYLNKFIGSMPTIGKNFCPKNGTGQSLWADCKAPEIVCDCCNTCS